MTPTNLNARCHCSEPLMMDEATGRVYCEHCDGPCPVGGATRGCGLCGVMNAWEPWVGYLRGGPEPV